MIHARLEYFGKRLFRLFLDFVFCVIIAGLGAFIALILTQ